MHPAPSEHGQAAPWRKATPRLSVVDTEQPHLDQYPHTLLLLSEKPISGYLTFHCAGVWSYMHIMLSLTWLPGVLLTRTVLKYLFILLLLLWLSRFSRVWLCDPIDGSPPGSSVPEILQARTLEWVAISFSLYPFSSSFSTSSHLLRTSLLAAGTCLGSSHIHLCLGRFWIAGKRCHPGWCQELGWVAHIAQHS